MSTRTDSSGARARSKVDHPIVDADGHFLQLMPAVREILGEIADASVVKRFDQYGQRGGHLPVRAFWGLPTEATRDRMTATLPGLLYERLDEIGIDFAVMYPTPGPRMTESEPEVRQATFRAFNIYAAEVFAGFEDRLAPVALIPTFSPEEAIAELEFAVSTLGFKAIRMEGTIPRSRRPDGSNVAWVDTLGHESLYDYDPLWAKCVELKIAPSFHGIGFGWGSRVSTRNYVHNHIGAFSSAQEAVCRSLIMGGVPKRFPELRFAFLEGGVAWACELFAGLVGHYEKRNKQAIRTYDPSRFDLALGNATFADYATGRLARLGSSFDAEMRAAMTAAEPESIDDFEEAGIGSVEEIYEVFRRQLFFGCEADDSLNALAFESRLLPGGGQLNALFSSDIGHWDVRDMSRIVGEAWEQVENGFLTSDQFREFTFGNVTRMFTAVNPGFFDGTVVGEAVDADLTGRVCPP